MEPSRIRYLALFVDTFFDGENIFELEPPYSNDRIERILDIQTLRTGPERFTVMAEMRERFGARDIVVSYGGSDANGAMGFAAFELDGALIAYVAMDESNPVMEAIRLESGALQFTTTSDLRFRVDGLLTGHISLRF